jgi:IS30 family transposase
MYRSGQYTVTAIATTLGVSRASIYRHLTRRPRQLSWRWWLPPTARSRADRLRPAFAVGE